MGGPQAHGNSIESRALTHLESIGLGNAAFISMGGPQAHGNSQNAHPGSGSSQISIMLVLNPMKAARILICWLAASTAFIAAQAQKKPEVFLITIDTLRDDHVHCYGYEPIQTPALDGLANDGIRFSQAFTPSPITNTSHASILTG